MITTLADISQRALNLPPKSRAELADALLDSLEPTRESDNERRWIDLAKRRDEDINGGRVKLVSHEEVMKKASDALK